jgi:hypothetical protein
MRLCTFEITTHRGRVRRAGALKDGRVIDLNSALAWYMDQQREPEPQQLADALVPPTLPEFLRAGLRATHSAEELFLGSGPHPADWWLKDPPPRGPNQETLVYPVDAVRLCAPLCGLPQFAKTIGPEDDAPGAASCEFALAAIAGHRRTDLSVFTLAVTFDSSIAMGPAIATLDEVLDPYRLELIVRINGGERRLSCAGLEAEFERTLAERERTLAIRPGELILLAAGSAPTAPGDHVEVEAEHIGTLRNRVS